MPIGAPFQRPEPKSGCRAVSAPIESTIAAEFLATGSRSTRWFHGLSFGNTGQPARRGEPAVEPARASVPVATARANVFMRAACRLGRVLPRGRGRPPPAPSGRGTRGRRRLHPRAPRAPRYRDAPHRPPRPRTRDCRTPSARPIPRERAARDRSGHDRAGPPRIARAGARPGAIRRGRGDRPAPASLLRGRLAGRRQAALFVLRARVSHTPGRGRVAQPWREVCPNRRTLFGYGGVPTLQLGEPRGGKVLRRLWQPPGRVGGDAARDPEDGHRPLLRRDRLDDARRAAGPRADPPRPLPLLPGCAGGARAPPPPRRQPP